MNRLSGLAWGFLFGMAGQRVWNSFFFLLKCSQAKVQTVQRYHTSGVFSMGLDSPSQLLRQPTTTDRGRLIKQELLC